jgi:hypothetical protein
MSPQLLSNRKIRPEGERLGCSKHQPFQKKKGEGARSGNLLFIFIISKAILGVHVLKNHVQINVLKCCVICS